MAYTSGRYHLTNLLQDMYFGLGQLRAYPVTGGTTGTVVVGQLANENSVDAGVAFIVESTDNAAPEGEYQRISAYTKSSGTFTTGTFTAAPAAGDKVAIANDLFPVHTMVEAANQALQSLGDIDLVDTTTLDTASAQTEYSCEIAWKRGGFPFRLDIQGNTSDANDNQWYTLPIGRWEYIPALPGSAGVIITKDQLVASRDVRVWYKSRHPRLNTYDDFIDEAIHPDLARAAACVEAINWMHAMSDGERERLLYIWEAKLESAKREHKIPRSHRKMKTFTVPRGSNETAYDPDPAKIRI